MKYAVSLDGSVDFAPQNEVAEILQNVRTILATWVGTVPLARDFGLSREYLDMPVSVARTLIQADIIDKVEEYEPRAKVRGVEFNNNTDDAREGILPSRVIVSIGEEEDF